MPQPGKRWRHVTIGTHNAWLPGDKRGFRNSGHRIHSSGDYKSPPPDGEHAGLYRYAKLISGRTVVIPKKQRRIVLHAIYEKLQRLECRVVAIAVGGMHAHFLVELANNLSAIRHVVGQCKAASSNAIREVLPGQVWARGGDWEPVDSKSHHRNTHHYIMRHKGAWVWSITNVERYNP